jgi:hypothetical protein
MGRDRSGQTIQLLGIGARVFVSAVNLALKQTRP